MREKRQGRGVDNVNGMPNLSKRKPWGFCLLLLAQATSSLAADWAHLGFFYDDFDLTLANGHRTEALGPLFYFDERETQTTWAVPPLFARTRDPETESEEIDVLYPLISYDRYGGQYRWHIG